MVVSRRLASCLATLLLVGAVLVSTSTGAGAAGSTSSSADPGVGSAAALANPNCDPATKRVKFPSTTAAPCVKSWKDGADNGGATAQGVTKDSVKVVMLYLDPLPANIQAQKNVVNAATGQAGSQTASILDTSKVYETVYETWGRKPDFVFVQASGTDEASQRADAVKIAAMKPFAVMQSYGAGGTAFEAAIVHKVPVLIGLANCCGFIPQTELSRPVAENAAEWIGKALVGGKAQWAGDDSLKSKPRVFGVVAPTGPAGIDPKIFASAFAKRGGKVAASVTYDSGTNLVMPPPESVDLAPSLIAKLKASGVTTVVDFADGLGMNPALTKAATQQSYFPEWVVTGNGFHDLDLLARNADQQQWAHAFGLLFFAPYVDVPKDQQTTPFQWYWGKNEGTTSGGATSLMTNLYTGLQLAGPKLTAKSFEQGLVDRYPPSGGAFSGEITTLEQSWAKFGTAPARGSALGWWSPDTVGPSQVVTTVGPGKYMFLNGGKRYTGGKFPKGLPKFFDKSASISVYESVPASDVPPNYPCDNCPSAGKGPAPSA